MGFFRGKRYGCSFRKKGDAVLAVTRGWGPTPIAQAEIESNKVISITTCLEQVVEDMKIHFPDIRVYQRRLIGD